MAHVQRLLTEGKRFGSLDASFTRLFAVDIEGNLSALGDAATIVFKLHSDLMFASMYSFRPLDISFLKTEKVITEFRLAFFCVQTPAPCHPSHGDDYPVGTGFR